MMGGNAPNGWLFKTRNPGSFDITEHKRRLSSISHLIAWMKNLQELTIEELQSQIQCDFSNKESVKNYRRAYL